MNLRRLLFVVGLLGLGVLIAASIGDLPQFWAALTTVQWYVLPLVIVAQFVSYYANARYYQTFFASSGSHVGTRRLFEISLAINVANQVIPAGGVAGTAFLTTATKPEVSSGTATLAQVGRYIFTFLSYFAVLAAGFVILFLTSNNLGQISVRLLLLFLLGVLAGCIFALSVFRERRRLEVALKPTLRLIERMGRLVLRRPMMLVDSPRYHHFLDEFYLAFHKLKGNHRAWSRLFWWALVGNIAEVATVYAAFVGFESLVNPGVVIIGYTLAIAASILGIFTGGVGVYEAGMVGAFAALGVPFTLAFAVVLIHRVLNMALFLPPGAYLYHKYLKH